MDILSVFLGVVTFPDAKSFANDSVVRAVIDKV